MSARFAVGIDLGTTHTAIALCALTDEQPQPALLRVPQTTAPSETSAQPLLPSFVYLPTAAELGPQALALPWQPDRAVEEGCIGAFARDRLPEVPGRVISSAKSWLCHAGVDRHAGLLPKEAPEDLTRLSPVEVSARILQHVKAAFEYTHPGIALADQDVVLTVPASFDAVARSLTEAAAREAGLQRLTLLEEPQAALYAWVAARGDGWRKAVNVGDRILVIDIGGGTTDFSLIAVEDHDGQLVLSRIKVGDHILLGGDNMDLALAYQKKATLEAQDPPVVIDDWQLRSLMAACRTAKEHLLSSEGAASAPIVIKSRGRKLVAGSIRTELSRSDVDAVVCDGFFPLVHNDARPHKAKRQGLVALDLPYAHDAAITRHLAAFLDDNRPTHVLFNGGVAKSKNIRERLLAQLTQWLGQAPVVLDSDDVDTAVALGAAVYGHVRQGKGVRIKGGTSRAYYVGIERAQLAVPGLVPPIDAVCIAAEGLEEGATSTLATVFGLSTGEAVQFRFFEAKGRAEQPGAVLTSVAALTELPAIETTISGLAGATVPVRLAARVSAVGTLELLAIEVDAGTEHRLEFDIRTAR